MNNIQLSVFLVFMLLSLAAKSSGDVQTHLVATTGQVFEGMDSLRPITVVIVPIETAKDTQMLMRVSGIKSRFNHKTLLYNLFEQTTPYKRDFILAGFDSKYLIFRGQKTLQKGSLKPYGQLYFENEPVNVIYTKLYENPQEIVEAYFREQSIALGKKQSVTKIEQTLQKQAEYMQMFCKITHLSIHIDWDAFPVKAQLPLVGVHYIQALASLCEEDHDYQEEIRGITKIKFISSSDNRMHHVIRKTSELIVSLAAKMPNTGLMSRHWFEENL